jgi:hypothetical protein
VLHCRTLTTSKKPLKQADIHHILQERIFSAPRVRAVRRFDVAQRTRRLLPSPWRNTETLKRMGVHFCTALRNGGEMSARDQLKDGFDIGTASDVKGRIHVQQ